MLGAVDLAQSQVADQQLVPAKDVQRQETVVIVVAVEEPAFLLAVYLIVGRIEVQYQLLRRSFERGNELFDHNPVHPPCRLPIRPVLPPAQRRTARQLLIAIQRRLNRQVPA